jgi:hypothetical protein
MKPRKFTFKRQPAETGLRSVGNPYPNVDIKLNKTVVGYIDAPYWQTADNLWRVRLKVVDVNQLSGWRWITLKQTFENEDKARKFLQLHTEEILRKWPIYGIWKVEEIQK